MTAEDEVVSDDCTDLCSLGDGGYCWHRGRSIDDILLKPSPRVLYRSRLIGRYAPSVDVSPTRPKAT